MEKTTEKLNLVRQFGKLFSLRAADTNGGIIPESERVGYMEPTNVCMIIPKNRDFKALLETTFDVTPSKIPELDYKLQPSTNPDHWLINKAKFSTGYLKILLELSKNYETMTISIKPDYPMTAEVEDFIFILASKLEND